MKEKAIHQVPNSNHRHNASEEPDASGRSNSSTSESPNKSHSDPDCIFCTIIATYPPVSPIPISPSVPLSGSRQTSTTCNPSTKSADQPSSTTSQPRSISQYLSILNEALDPNKLSPPAYVILSTPEVVAFLDIAPLTRGHTLVVPRRHRHKVGDLNGRESAALGRILPALARTVVKTVMPDIPHEEVDYNIVQNNGPGAAQVIPHVHFHIIPRPPLNYEYPPLPSFPTDTDSASDTSTSLSSMNSSDSPSTPLPSTSSLDSLNPNSVSTSTSNSNSSPPTHTSPSNSTSSTSSTLSSPRKTKSKYTPNTIPTGLKASYIQFGRGARQELDDDEAEVLVREMRKILGEELVKSGFGRNSGRWKGRSRDWKGKGKLEKRGKL